MKISKNLILILNEKANIDWNNYLTKEEVSLFLQKDDKVESAENIIYSKNFVDRLKEFKKSGWTRRELAQDLSNFYDKGHLNEGDLDLWKRQMDNNDTTQLLAKLKKLYSELADYNTKNSDIKSRSYFDIVDKINYIESRLGIQSKIGREIH